MKFNNTTWQATVRGKLPKLVRRRRDCQFAAKKLRTQSLQNIQIVSRDNSSLLSRMNFVQHSHVSIVRPTKEHLMIKNKSFSSAHTYSTLLVSNGENVKVIQELMRHASSVPTARNADKRVAQQGVMQMIFPEDLNRNEWVTEHKPAEADNASGWIN